VAGDIIKTLSDQDPPSSSESAIRNNKTKKKRRIRTQTRPSTPSVRLVHQLQNVADKERESPITTE